jgi:hypothetical protein
MRGKTYLCVEELPGLKWGNVKFKVWREEQVDIGEADSIYT